MALTFTSDNRAAQPSWMVPAMYLLLFIIAAGSFYILDLQGIWIGDDLGYMFTDSILHSGDGHRLASPEEIITTQASHWMTCNGRFIVHSLVQLFVGFLGKEVFCAVNALMFGLLVIFTCRLTLPWRHFGLGSGLAVALLLWLCLPRPGVTMLSLASYAINYLWTGVIILGFLLFWRALEEHRVHRAGYLWGCLFALVAGSLQESYSVPVAAALIVWWYTMGRRATSREISVIICFTVGTLAVLFAPGNIYHAAQGGGVAPQALLAKIIALGKDLLISPLNFLAIAIVIWWLIKPYRCAQYCSRNLTLLAAVIAALALALVSYTAVRQLFAPCLFSAILIGRMFCGERVTEALNSPLALAGCLIIYGGVMVGAHAQRRYPQEISRSIVHQAAAGNRAIYIPAQEEEKSPLENWLFDRYNDDPVGGRDLHLVFDRYTKRGLSRLYSPGRDAAHISTILPTSQLALEQAAAKSRLDGEEITPAPLTERYDCFRLPDPDNSKIFHVRSRRGKRFSYERIYSEGYVYYVVPAGLGTLTIADAKAERAAEAAKEKAETEKKVKKQKQRQLERRMRREEGHPANPTAPDIIEQ